MLNKIKDISGAILFETLIGAVVLGLFFSIVGIAGYYETHYTMDCTVLEVGQDYEVLLLDKTGQEWFIYADGVAVDDDVKVTFFDNGTVSRFDDVVEKIKIKG